MTGSTRLAARAPRPKPARGDDENVLLHCYSLGGGGEGGEGTGLGARESQDVEYGAGNLGERACGASRNPPRGPGLYI